MVRSTLVFAVVLIVLGVIGYAGAASDSKPVASGNTSAEANDDTGLAKPKRSITALIPAFAGSLLLICGLIALNANWRMHAMHGAALIGLLGFLAAGGRGVSGIANLMSSDPAVNGRSLSFVCVMAVICGVYVGMSINSFVQARRRREEQNAQPA